jgi:oligopeptide transport system substrate-binding protein
MVISSNIGSLLGECMSSGNYANQLLADYIDERSLSRRNLCKLSLGAAVTLAGIPLLSACGEEDEGVAESNDGAAASDDTGEEELETDDEAVDEELDTDVDDDDAEGEEAPEDIATDVTLTIPIVTTLDLTLDPNKALNYAIFGNLYPYIYAGLVTYDPDARAEPDLAEDWEVSDDGINWTFHLREAHFASGRQVTPEDCLYSWKRALDPDVTASTAHYFEHILGHQAFVDGEADELEGVEIVDDATISIQLSEPYTTFLSYMCTFPWLVVDRELVEEYGDHNNSDWTNHGAYGAGPWQVVNFDPTSEIALERNEYYYGAHSESITRIDLPILRGPVAENTGLNMYKADQADVLPNFPLSLLDAVEEEFEDEVTWVVASGTISVAMNFAEEPFDNVLVRRAFGKAIDRDTLGDVVWRGTRTPTTCFTPPNVPDYDCPDGLEYDPDEARELLEAAGFPGGEGLPEITMYVSSEASGEDVNRTRALAEMWIDTLGANVTVDTSRTTSQITELREERGGFQLEVMGWINIQETPNFVTLMRSDNPFMENRFNWGIDVPSMEFDGEDFDPTSDSQRFDELLEQALIEQDPESRNEMYYEAESLMLRNAVYVPWANYRFPCLAKSRVKGLQWGAYFYNFPHPVRQGVYVENS